MKAYKDDKAKPEGMLVKKGNAAAGDPTVMANPQHKNVLQKIGARYGIRVKFQANTEPAAGATQANGRIMPASIKSPSKSFGMGTVDHE